MALYDYKCLNKDCEDFNKLKEYRQKITEEKIKTCPVCNEDAMERQITKASQINFIGYNWFSKGGSY